MNQYRLGEQVYLDRHFSQFGVAVNPANLTVHFRTEDANDIAFTPTQGNNGTADTTATGDWFYLYTTTVSGRVAYTWYSGTTPVGDGEFLVSPPVA